MLVESCAKFIYINECGDYNKNGYVNRKDDPGGETIAGITKKNWPEWFDKAMAVKNDIDALHKVHEDFVREVWWNPLYDKIRSEDFAIKLCDWTYLSGKIQIIRKLQIMLYDSVVISIDGIFGKNTLSVLNACLKENEAWTWNTFKIVLTSYYRRCSGWKDNGKGWIARMNRDVTETLKNERV